MKVTELLENENLPIFRAIYPICAEAHKDQKRKDGKPYMTHVDAVIEGCLKAKACIGFSDIKSIDMILSAAAAHDVLEDQPDKVTLKELVHIFAKSAIMYEPIRVRLFEDAVQKLSKKLNGIKTYKDYADYVSNVKLNEISRIVKIADLKHNMSDLSDGNLKEKYQLTLAVLEGRFV